MLLVDWHNWCMRCCKCSKVNGIEEVAVQHPVLVGLLEEEPEGNTLVN